MPQDRNIDDIIEAVLSDKELFAYIEKLVRNRLSPETRRDYHLCCQVIDATIDEAIYDVNLVEIINSLTKTKVRNRLNFSTKLK